MTSLVGIWEMMVVAGKLEEKCVSFEQYLTIQVLQFRGNMFKSLTTVSESVCGLRGLIQCNILPSFKPSLTPSHYSTLQRHMLTDRRPQEVSVVIQG